MKLAGQNAVPRILVEKIDWKENLRQTSSQSTRVIHVSFINENVAFHLDLEVEGIFGGEGTQTVDNCIED